MFESVPVLPSIPQYDKYISSLLLRVIYKEVQGLEGMTECVSHNWDNCTD